MSTSVKTKRKWQRSHVPTTALAKSIAFAGEMMQVNLTDGRILSVPIDWFPALQKATAKQCEIRDSAGGRSLHWPEIDEDLSVAGMMAGGDVESM